MGDQGVMPPPKPQSFNFKTNADFRRMLETPRAERAHEGDEARHDRPARKQAGAPATHKKKSRPKPAHLEEKEDADEPAYRDRAEERRKGVNPDYERVNADLASIVTGNAALERDLGAISVEDSKFLGGDVEHTHLVKGLDYALLQKVRGEMTKQEIEEAADAKKKAKPIRREEMTFVTPTGRAVFNALFNPPRIAVAELFAPRRTAFVYELDSDPSTPDIPTTLRRSKADCPPVVESLMGAVDAGVLERLAKIMAYMRPAAGGGKAGRKLKRKEKLSMLGELAGDAGGAAPPLNGGLKGSLRPQEPQEPAVVRPVDEDEDIDIFGDAGKEYMPDLSARAGGDAAAAAPAAAGQQAQQQRGAYFAERDDMRDLPALPDPAARTDEDMELEDGEPGGPPGPPPGPPPPPPPPPADGADFGPARPPPGADFSSAYADPAAYEAYVQSNVAYQASTDPEYQALLAKQGAGGGAAAAAAAAAAAGMLSQQQKEAGLASVFKRDDENLARRREVDEREKDPAFVSDAYAECYPEYHGYNATIVDSDDEADYSHMDSKFGKGRTDFQTEEEWQEYKNNKEMLPKAAFQFGVKASDGRKAGNKLGKAREGKINSQLSKIQSILEKDGGDYSKAFSAAALTVGDGGRTSKKRRI